MYGQMRTDGVYRQEVTNRVYVQEYKEWEDKNTRTLRLNEKHIFGTSLSHNFLKTVTRGYATPK